jgi:hypothetical protein
MATLTQLEVRYQYEEDVSLVSVVADVLHTQRAGSQLPDFEVGIVADRPVSTRQISE